MNYAKSKFACTRGPYTIRGVEYRPAGEKLPVAIICHGFMANRASVLQYVRFFAKKGYAAYAFDFCGGCVIGGKSDGKTRDMSVLTQVEDLMAVMDYVSSLPYTDEGDLTLMGCSQGGLVCALTAAELPRSVARLVLFYPAFCIPDDARAGRMMFARFDPKSPPQTVRCGPMKLGRQYVTDVIDMDPFERITAYRSDVLILHGTKDGIVAPDYSRRAHEAYAQREQGAVILRMIRGGRHMFSRKHDAIALQELEAFLK